MPKYSEAKIYKLECNDGYYYIGSTTSHYLSSRLSNHRNDSKRINYVNTKVYKHIKQIGWENVKIVLIELFPCNCIEELKKKENEYILKNINDSLCLNNNRPILSEEQKNEYYKIKKQREKDKRNNIVYCETCNKNITFGRLNQHNNTAIHKNLLEKNLILEHNV